MSDDDLPARIIETSRKEKLPKGFSYPLGAMAISSALDGIPQFDNAEITFNWQDEHCASKWRKRVKAQGVITLFEVYYFDYFGRWWLRVNSVPSQYSMLAREHLRSELRRVHREFLVAGPASKSIHASIMFDLSKAGKELGASHF